MNGWYVHCNFVVDTMTRKPVFSIAALPVGEPNISDVPRDGSLVRIMNLDASNSFLMYFNEPLGEFETLDGRVRWNVDQQLSRAGYWRTEHVH